MIKLKFIVVCIVVLCLLSGVFPGFAAEQYVNKDTIRVQGHFNITRQPDVAYIILYVASEGALLEEAMSKVNTKVQKLQTALQEAYEEIQQITISDWRIGVPPTPWGQPAQQSESAEVHVVKQVCITVPPTHALLHTIVDTALQYDALIEKPSSYPYSSYPGEVQSCLLYSITDNASAEQEAMKAAIEDARQKAQLVAKFSEKEIGNIIEILDSCFATGPLVYRPVTVLPFPVKYMSIRSDSVNVSGCYMVTFEFVK